MALQRDNTYPGRFTPATPEQPQGAFKNRTTATAQDGSYLEQQWVNDWSGFFSSLLSNANITANGNVDEVGSSQYFDALRHAVINTRTGDPEYSFSTTPQPWQIPATGDTEFSRATDDVLWQFAQDNNLVVSQALKDADPFQYAGKYGDGDGATTFTTPDLRDLFLRGAPDGVANGETQGDAIRNITGRAIPTFGGSGSGFLPTQGFEGAMSAVGSSTVTTTVTTGTTITTSAGIKFDASDVVPTSDENRPKTLNLTVYINRGKII